MTGPKSTQPTLHRADSVPAFSDSTVDAERRHWLPTKPVEMAVVSVATPVRAYLVPLIGDGAGEMHLLSGPTTLGRDQTSTIRVSDPSVSRRHAVVNRGKRGGFIIEDLGSANGTHVNGKAIACHQLRFGDKIQLGDRTMLLFTQRDGVDEQLQQAQRLESLGRLAGGIAHDVNNLLGALQFSIDYLDAMISGTLDVQQLNSCLTEQSDAVRRAAQLTSQLIGFARSPVSERKIIDVGHAVSEVTQLLRRTLDRSVRLEVELAPNLHSIADAAEIHQILMNLCLNARDAMPNGGVLRIEGYLEDIGGQRATDIPLITAGPHVVIAVEDDGAGMDDHTRGRAFEPFFTTKDVGKGTGIGLSTVYGIVSNLGGQIQLQTQVGQGTRISILLPAAQPTRSSGNASGASSTVRVHQLRPEERMTVLVVDDDDLMRTSIQRLLQAHGHEVIICADGPSAIAKHRNHLGSIDVALLDLVMPGMDGIATLDALRRDDPTLVVWMLSGYSDADQQASLGERDVHGFLSKPCDSEMLLAAIATGGPPAKTIQADV